MLASVRVVATIATIAVTYTTLTPRAQAQDRDGAAWAFVGLDGVAISAALVESQNAFDSDIDELRANLWFLGAALTAGLLGYAGHEAPLNPTIGRTLHGALATGGTMLLLGALIDGALADDHPPARLGVVSIVLASVGAIGGGIFGALATEGQDVNAGWLAAPWLGVLAAGLVLPLAFSIDDENKREHFIGWGALCALTAGLTLAYVSAAVDFGRP